MHTDSFNALKERIQDLVTNNLGEVTNQTKHKTGGIYMLYVDDFSDNKIIPFYIGRSSNFQTRHKQHVKCIIALNRFSSAYYNALLKNFYYDGHFLYCKIFEYMVRHKCQLRQLRMVILEQIENTDVMDAAEEKYIAELAAPYVGFNQIQSLTYRNTLQGGASDEQAKHYYSFLEFDAKMCAAFAGFGYTDFNVKIALPRNAKHALPRKVEFRGRENIDTFQIQTALNALFEQQPAYTEFREQFSQYEAANAAQVNLIEQRESEAKQARDALKQHLGLFTYDYFGIHDEYDNFPLGDIGPNLTMAIQKPGSGSGRNKCIINFVISCARKSIDLTPRIVAIQYIMLIGNDVQTDTLFITNHSRYFYVEKGIEAPPAVRLFVPKNIPMTPVASANPENSMQLIELSSTARLFEQMDSDIAPSDYITVSSEYKTGINDHTVHSHCTVSFEQALSSIESSLPLNAKITIKTTESKGQLARAVENEALFDDNSRVHNALLQFLN